MLLGIDANGRSLRWLDPDRGRKGTRYAVAGVPPLFPDEQFIWNNPSAADPTFIDGLIPLEEAWARLSYLEPRGTPRQLPLRWRYRGADADSTLNPAEAIANAIRQNTPIDHAGEMVAVAIPNHLDETGQDDLISALHALGIFNVRLLWRPIALAMSWASRNPDRAKALVDSGGSLWVMDFESYGLEITELKWRRHPREANYVCPVRAYPRRSDFDPGWASRHWADKIAGSVCGEHGRSSSLLWGPAGGDFQRYLEGEPHGALVFRDKDDPRRWSLGEPVPVQLHQDVVALAGTIGRLVHGLQPHDRILVHGWPVAHIGELLARQLRRGIDMADKYAAAEGAALYASRTADMRPTYLDTLPQYAIWVSQGDEHNQLDFLWKKLNDESTVDAGDEWVLSKRTEPDLVQIREAMLSLPRYVDKFSLLVQNKTVYDEDKRTNPEADANKPGNHKADIPLAKRLVVDLPAMTMTETPLQLEMVLRPASGHAKFSISTRDEQPLFADRHSVDMSWKTAQDEPEHKGYLEAREVVGRIMDKRENREMARLICRRIKEELLQCATTGCQRMNENEKRQLNILLNDYRPDFFSDPPYGTQAILEKVLVPWGAEITPAQPTRGLWGSRRHINDPELDEIAKEMREALIEYGKGDAWYKWQNCMFVYTHPEFIKRIQKELSVLGDISHIDKYSQAYSPGRIFNSASDFELLIRFIVENEFHGGKASYRAKYWWSIFRCLCYHKATNNVDSDLVRKILDKMCTYLKAAPHLRPNEKKYGLHVLLFALRLREPKLSNGHGDCDQNADTHRFLPTDDPLVAEFNNMIDHGCLAGQVFPPSMLAGMKKMERPGDNFSKYVRRFLNFEDTLADREMGAGLATS